MLFLPTGPTPGGQREQWLGQTSSSPWPIASTAPRLRTPARRALLRRLWPGGGDAHLHGRRAAPRELHQRAHAARDALGPRRRSAVPGRSTTSISSWRRSTARAATVPIAASTGIPWTSSRTGLHDSDPRYLPGGSRTTARGLRREMDKSWPSRTGGTAGCPQARLATRRFGCAPLSPSSRSVGPSRVFLDTVIEPSAPADGVRRVRLARIARHPWLLEITMVRPVLGPSVIARYDHELVAVDGIARTGIASWTRRSAFSPATSRARPAHSTSRRRSAGRPARPGVVDGARANSRAAARPGDVSRGGRGAGPRRLGHSTRPHTHPSIRSSSVCNESSTGSHRRWRLDASAG